MVDDTLIENLKTEEGFKPYLYDDANGTRIVRGYTLVGNPTIGYGWSLDTAMCPEDLAEYILRYFVSDTQTQLLRSLPWLVDHPQTVQNALVDMAYNLGVNGLLTFKQFISLIKNKQYFEAAQDLDGTLWARQTSTRALSIEKELSSI